MTIQKQSMVFSKERSQVKSEKKVVINVEDEDAPVQSKAVQDEPPQEVSWFKKQL